MKKKYLIIASIVIIAVSLFVVFRGSEDSWIKDERGVYVKHGNPAVMPDEVVMQQDMINCALGLYENASVSGINFNSQCLGTCRDYAVDIVHVLRTNEDNIPENQCDAFRSGQVKHFIELDANGEIVRIA